MNSHRGILGNFLLACAVLLLLAFTLFPFVQMLSISLKYQPEWDDPNPIPSKINWESYAAILDLHIRDPRREARVEFERRLDALGFSDSLRAEIQVHVDGWYERTADLDSLIGNFKGVRKDLRETRKKIIKLMTEGGVGRKQAVVWSRTGIMSPVKESALGVLTFTDKRPEDQRKQLEEFTSTAQVFPFLTFFRNSLLFALAATTASLILSIFGSYALARLQFPGRAVFSRGVLLTYMIGGVMLMVPLYQVAVGLGLLKTAGGAIATIVVIYMMQTLPVSLYMLGNYFRTIAFSLEEAAAMDGYGRVETIFRVVLPLSLPMVATVFVYCFAIAWNEYLFVSVMLRDYPDLHTLPVGLRNLTQSVNSIWDLVCAASILTLLPVVLMFGLAMRKVTAGLAEGGVKG